MGLEKDLEKVEKLHPLFRSFLNQYALTGSKDYETLVLFELKQIKSEFGKELYEEFYHIYSQVASVHLNGRP
jgi:hypothetical protein